MVPKVGVVVPQSLTPYWQTTDGETVRLFQGDVLNVLKRLPSQSVQCVITSPPYFGLRDYGTGTWTGGNQECDHVERYKEEAHKSSTLGPTAEQRMNGDFSREHPADNSAFKATARQFAEQCRKCGATRTDYQLGSERVPDCLGWARGENCAERDWSNGCHVCRIVLVFREIRRVMRDDAVCFLNYGDTYASGNCDGESVFAAGRTDGRPGDGGIERTKLTRQSLKTRGGYSNSGLPAGNLCGIPWRVALALQADGWVLRQDIVWQKPSPMPESVQNRCTKSHEYVFLLTKGTRYFYDAEAIKEGEITCLPDQINHRYVDADRTGLGEHHGLKNRTSGRANKRSVWTIDDNRTLLDYLALHNPELLEQFLSEQGYKSDVWRIASQGYPGAHYACVDDETEALCIDGWKRRIDLREGQLIAAYQMSTGQLRWEPINAIASYGYNGEMCVLGGLALGFRVTPNHRCLVKTRSGAISARKADDLVGGLSVPTAAEWSDGTFGKVDDPGPEWAELLGWILAEGHYLKYSICVYQSLAANPDKVDRIRRLLESLKIEFSECTQKRQWNDRRADIVRFAISWKFASGIRSWIPNKKPRWDMLGWSKVSLQALWDSLVDGDGHRREDGRISFIQKDKATTDWFQALSVRLGKRAILSKRSARGGCYTVFTTKHDWHSLRGTNGIGAVLSREHYEGTVWCPSVESGFWLARRNGRLLITGNTFPPKLIEPMVLAGTSAKGACAKCGGPWKRVVERTGGPPNNRFRDGLAGDCKTAHTEGTVAGAALSRLYAEYGYPKVETIRWEPTCTCYGEFVKRKGTRKGYGAYHSHQADGVGYGLRQDGGPLSDPGEPTKEFETTIVEYVPSIPLEEHPIRPCVLLDPFIGSGTCAVVALEHGRQCWGIDLSTQYLRENAIPRIKAFFNSRPDLRHMVEREVKSRMLGRVVSQGA